MKRGKEGKRRSVCHATQNSSALPIGAPQNSCNLCALQLAKEFQFFLSFFCFLSLFSFSFGKDFIQTAGGEFQVCKSELKLLISIILLMASKMRSCARRLQWFVRILWMNSIIMQSISRSIVLVQYFLFLLFYWLLIFFKYHSPICHVISLNTIQSYVSVCQFIVVYTVTYVYLIASMS